MQCRSTRCTPAAHGVFSASCYVAAVVFHFQFFFSFVSKMLFSFTGCHRSKCTSRFYSSRLYNEAENELAGCTDTNTKNKISMTLELEFYYFYYFHVRKVCVSASVMWRVMGAVCVVVTHRVEFECKIMHNFWYRFMAYAFDARYRMANAVDWWHFCAANMPFVAWLLLYCVWCEALVSVASFLHTFYFTGSTLAHAMETRDTEKKNSMEIVIESAEVFISTAI